MFLNSGYRPADIEQYTLRILAIWGIDGFLEVDVDSLIDWSKALLELNLRIKNNSDFQIYCKCDLSENLLYD